MMKYCDRNYARGGGYYRRGDIVYVEREIEETKGHEQLPGRPAVIVSNVTSGTCMVVYLTTNEAKATDSTLHVRISTAARPSVALCDQIKTVDTRRLGNWYGHVTQTEAEALDRAMLKALAVQDANQAKMEEEKLQGLLLAARAEAKAWKEIALKFAGGVRSVKIVGTEKETDWLIEALAVAGCCGDCPARKHCRETDEAEEQSGVPEGERTSCGEMLRDVIKIKNKKERKKKCEKGGCRAARKSTV